MDIKDALLAEHSKTQATKIASYVEKDPQALEELMQCFFSNEYRINQRAAWPLCFIGLKRPELVKPYFSQMLKNLEKPNHDAVIRNTIRILQDMEIPEEYLGEVYEKCFEYLIDPKYAIAIKVFSTTVLTNIAGNFPELIPELILAIEDQVPHGSTGFKNRAAKELKRLRKMSM